MYDRGWRNIVNIDYSPALIAQMKAKHSVSRPNMEWHEMDIRKLAFQDGTFDVALDKGEPSSPTLLDQKDNFIIGCLIQFP